MPLGMAVKTAASFREPHEPSIANGKLKVKGIPGTVVDEHRNQILFRKIFILRQQNLMPVFCARWRRADFSPCKIFFLALAFQK